MDALAVFGISNDGLNLAVKLIILFLVAVWLALVFWTWSDGRRRIEDPLLVGCAAAASFFFPFVGTVVYMIVRPPEYLEDVREREIEMAAAEARLQQVQSHSCPNCGFEVERSYLRCPSCARKLKEPCRSCNRPIDPKWKICPYCETEVARAATAETTRPRRSAARSSRPSTAAAARADRPPPPPPPPPARSRPRTADRDAPTRPRPPQRSTIDEPTAAHPAARPSPEEPPIRRTPRPRPDTT